MFYNKSPVWSCLSGGGHLDLCNLYTLVITNTNSLSLALAGRKLILLANIKKLTGYYSSARETTVIRECTLWPGVFYFRNMTGIRDL